MEGNLMKHVDYQAFNKDIVMGLVIGQESGGCLLIYAISLVTKRMMKPVRKTMIVARNVSIYALKYRFPIARHTYH